MTGSYHHPLHYLPEQLYGSLISHQCVPALLTETGPYLGEAFTVLLGRNQQKDGGGFFPTSSMMTGALLSTEVSSYSISSE